MVGIVLDLVLIVLLVVFIWALLTHKEQRPPADDGSEEAERQLEETHGNVHVLRRDEGEGAGGGGTPQSS